MAETKKKRGPGQPPFKPTDEERRLVQQMTAVGIKQVDIARVIRAGGICHKTLTKHFREEIDCGKTKAIAAVAGALFNTALAGNTSAQIFFLKTQARWTEPKQEIDISAPITIIKRVIVDDADNSNG